MTAMGVRRDKAALSSGCKPTRRFAPAGSNRSRHGGARSKKTMGLRPARSSSKTVEVMSSSRLTGSRMRRISSGKSRSTIAKKPRMLCLFTCLPLFIARNHLRLTDQQTAHQQIGHRFFAKSATQCSAALKEVGDNSGEGAMARSW